MKLKDKTGLRAKINNNFDTTLTLDKLHIYEDGSWEFLSCNSDIYHKPQYSWVSYLYEICENSGENRNINNKDITEFFKNIETDLENNL